MTDFKVWEPEEEDEDYGDVIRAPLAYIAAQEFCARKNLRTAEYPLCRTVCVKITEGFYDTFDVELTMDPIYTAKRKK